MREGEAVGKRAALGPGVRVGHRVGLDHQASEMLLSGQAPARLMGWGGDPWQWFTEAGLNPDHLPTNL